MKIPVLDAFILSQFDRGAQSAYDLHRKAGISLGASTPSLARLMKRKLVDREKGVSNGKRVRHVFRLTSAGRKAARTAWIEFVADEHNSFDLDSTLRIADMATHYGARREQLQEFLRRAGAERLKAAKEAAVAAQQAMATTRFSYLALKARCDADRLSTEAKILLTTADSLKRRRNLVHGRKHQIRPV